jgi:predicted Rossmann-fold nucleotide-binding protein
MPADNALRVCVYCASSEQVDRAYHDAAHALGGTLARAGCTVVYGGGAVGLMGSLANGALEAGGAVVGGIPRFMNPQHRDLWTRVGRVEDVLPAIANAPPWSADARGYAAVR